MAKHQPCSRLPLLGLLFFKALLRFEACWETKLLCHTTTCASSVWFPLALQSVKGGEGDFFFSSSLVHSSQQLPYPSLLSLAVTQQRLCRQPTQPGWKNPKADCCVNISHQGNMKCSVIFIHGIVWVILCHCYQAIFDMPAVRWGWAGQVVLAERNHREQRVEQCCRLRWGLELFLQLGKTGFRL